VTEDLVEELAAAEHRQWINWVDYAAQNGALVESAPTGWARKMGTWSSLPESDKEIFRSWARITIAGLGRGPGGRRILAAAEDPFPNVPVRVSRWTRWRVARVRRRRMHLLRRELQEARSTLEILADSERAGRWKKDLDAGRERVKLAWARYVEIQDARYADLRAKTDEISSRGVPR